MFSCNFVGIWTCKLCFCALVSSCGSRCLLQVIRCVVLVWSLLCYWHLWFYPWTLVFLFCSVALFYDLLVSPVPISLFAVVEVVVVCWSFFICIHWGGWLRYGLGKDLIDVVVSFICPNAYLARFELRSSTSSGKIKKHSNEFLSKECQNQIDTTKPLFQNVVIYSAILEKGRNEKGLISAESKQAKSPIQRTNAPNYSWPEALPPLKCTNACIEMHQCPHWNAPMPALKCTNAFIEMHERLRWNARMPALKCRNACVEMHQAPIDMHQCLRWDAPLKWNTCWIYILKKFTDCEANEGEKVRKKQGTFGDCLKYRIPGCPWLSMGMAFMFFLGLFPQHLLHGEPFVW